MVVRKGYASAAALVAVAALASVGCGGGNGGPEAAVEAALRTAVLSHDAAKCTEAMTATLREQATGEDGAEALAECKEDAVEDEHDPKGVAVSSIEIDGDHATAESTSIGGAYDGQTVLLSLVEVDGRWKVDRLVRITEFDRERILAGAAVGLAEAEETSPDQQRCMVARLGHQTQAEIEAVLVNRDEQALIDLVRACPGGDYHQPVRAQISDAIEALFVGEEPSACVEFATQGFVESVSGKSGVEAIVSCAAQVEGDGRADFADVSNLRIEEGGARVRVALRSEDQGDQVLIIALTREYGHWKADRVVRLVSIDRFAFGRGVLEGFTAAEAASDALPPT